MKKVDLKKYNSLRRGQLLTFKQFAKTWEGKLLFAQSRKKDVLSAEGKAIQGKTEIVSHRCAFEPVQKEHRFHNWNEGEEDTEPELLKVYSVHLEAGTFEIYTK